MSVDLRSAEAEDSDRIREVARSSFTTSYSLSPQEIDGIVEEQFAEEPLQVKREASDTVFLVAEVDDIVAGFVEGDLAEGRGEVRWLHVDPERRGGGAGSELMEAVTDELRERGAKHIYASSLASNTDGGMFFERMGFEQTDEREVTIGDEELVEHVYVAETAAESDDGVDGESTAAESTDGDETPPNAVSDDGRELFVGDDGLSGTEASFYRTYTDEERTDEFGYYCSNCGSTDVMMSDMERIRCSNCGNENRADEDYDASYL